MRFVGFVSSKASPVYGVFARAKRFEIWDHWLHDFLFQSSAACLVPSIAQTQRLSPSMQHPKPIQEHLTAIPDSVELIILKIDVSELFIYICRQENVCLEMMVMIITCRLNLELIPDILCVLIIFIRYITVIQLWVELIFWWQFCFIELSHKGTHSFLRPTRFCPWIPSQCPSVYQDSNY